MGGFEAVAPVLSVVSSVARGFGGGDSGAPAPAAAPPVPTRDDAEIRQKEREERLRRSKAKGLSSTILTRGLGDEDPQQQATKKKTLLGQ